MNILALDCGIRTGWASWSRGFMESGVQEFALQRGESPGMRFIRFRKWLVEMLKTTDAVVIAFEQAHHRGGYAVDLLVGMTTRIVEEAALRGIETAAVHSATLKKFATGSGRADKSAMMSAAEKRWGKRPATDDEADALCLLAWAIKNCGGEA